MKTFIGIAALAVFLWNSEGSNTGSLTGTVKNAQTGELIANSAVVVYPLGKGNPLRKALASDGRFAQKGIAVGQYSVSVVHEGFGPILAQGVFIKSNTVTVLNILLKTNKARRDSSDLVRTGKAGEDYTVDYYGADTTVVR